MQQPFPALKCLELGSSELTAPVVPTSLLGGSTPSLEALSLHSISFPGLPNLLLSATHLVHLTLFKIPHSGYFSPEAIVTCLSILTCLEGLHIEFEYSRSHPERKSRRPPLPTRTLLPVLADLQFEGAGEYLEDLVARIDAPLLNSLTIILFHQPIIDTRQLTQFISRAPKFKAPDEAYVEFSDWRVSIILPQASYTVLELAISSLSDQQLWCRSARPFLRLSFPRWNASSSTVDFGYCIGKMTLKAANGWNFSIYLQV